MRKPLETVEITSFLKEDKKEVDESFSKGGDLPTIIVKLEDGWRYEVKVVKVSNGRYYGLIQKSID